MATAIELCNEGDVFRNEGKFPEAIEKYEAAVAADPNCVIAFLSLAVVYGKVGEHEKAVKSGEQAIALEPNESFNYTAMSVTYQRAYAGTQNQSYIQLAEDAMAKSHSVQAGG
ncbi:MAG: tetratricopeptide repeat protein [bacterium]|nr:tetratricopeptide repeat protein [bacterium]